MVQARLAIVMAAHSEGLGNACQGPLAGKSGYDKAAALSQARSQNLEVKDWLI